MIDEVRYDLEFDTRSLSTQINFQRDLGVFSSDPVVFDQLGSIHLADAGEKDSLNLKIAIPTAVRAQNWPTEDFVMDDLVFQLPKAMKAASLKSWRISNDQGELHYLYSANHRLVVGMLWRDRLFSPIPKNSWSVQTLSQAGDPKVISAYLFGPTKSKFGGVLILSDFGEAAFDSFVSESSKSKKVLLASEDFPFGSKALLKNIREAFLKFKN